LNNFLKCATMEICNADPNVGATTTTLVSWFATLILSFRTCWNAFQSSK
jgi:hypothetical protein